MAGVQVLIIKGGCAEQGYSSGGNNVSRETSFRSGLIFVSFVGFSFVYAAFIGIVFHAFAGRVVSRETKPLKLWCRLCVIFHRLCGFRTLKGLNRVKTDDFGAKWGCFAAKCRVFALK